MAMPAKVDPDVGACRLIVVARHVDDLGPLAHLAEHFLDDVVVQLVPVPASLELPAIDDVAHEIEVVGLRVAEELE